MRIKRRQLLAGAAAAAGYGLLAPLAQAATGARRPNFVFIMADDLGWAGIGCYGRDDVATPVLDGLGRDGMQFMHGYANTPICSPTRTSLITGRYRERLRMGLEEPLGGDQLGLEVGTPTFPVQLKLAGYQTSLVGKWHLGSPLRFSPLKHGYDRFYGIRGGGVDYFSHDIRRNVPGHASESGKDLWDGDVPTTATGYFTDVLGDRAAREIVRMSREAAPYLLSLHFTAPHWPWEGPDDAKLSPEVSNALHFDGGNIATYRAMVESLDRNVARVLAAIEASGQADNTIVIFTSDNGGERFSKTWPLNGMKGELLEGGIRVPLLVRWPGRIPAGAVTGQMAISMDWAATFLELAGLPPERRMPLDGISLLPTLLEQRIQDRELFWRFKALEQAAMRQGPWKYLRINGGEFLFNVVEDPQERGNLKTRDAARFEAMKASWATWNSQVLAYPPESQTWDNRGPKSLPDRY